MIHAATEKTTKTEIDVVLRSMFTRRRSLWRNQMGCWGIRSKPKFMVDAKALCTSTAMSHGSCSA